MYLLYIDDTEPTHSARLLSGRSLIQTGNWFRQVIVSDRLLIVRQIIGSLG
jgi:hypothetical protein